MSKTSDPPRRETSQAKWRGKIRAANKGRWTPELKLQLKQKAARQQRVHLKYAKCSRARKTNLLARSAWADGMRNAIDSSSSDDDDRSESAAPAPAPPAALFAASAAARPRGGGGGLFGNLLGSLRRSSRSSAAAPKAQAPQTAQQSERRSRRKARKKAKKKKKAATRKMRCAQMETLQIARAMSDEEAGTWGAEEEEGSLECALAYNTKANAAMDRLEATMIADLDEGGEGVEEDEMAKLLQQLRAEPDTDDGREAKFSLYEKFGDTICQSRSRLFQFWEDCKKEFGHREEEGCAAPAPGAGEAGEGGIEEGEAGGEGDAGNVAERRPRAVRQIEGELKRIDDPRNLGFPDMSGRTWIIYHMATKVAKNNAMLDRVLTDIERRLGILSKQDECPICLEELDENPAVLGCCHKVCSECWANWEELQGARAAFCPLCRHSDFLGTVMGSDSEGDGS